MRKERNIENCISEVYLGGFRICYPFDNVSEDVKKYLSSKEGEYIIPSPIKKYRIARENYYGECIVRKDLAKELANIHVIRRNPRYVEYDYLRARYKREYKEPLKVKIVLEKDHNGQYFISSPVMNKSLDENIILMYLNLFKDIFGVFEIRNPEFDELIKIDARLKWDMLRPGHSLFIKENLINYIAKKNNTDENNVVRNYKPLFVKEYTDIGVGKEGFNGYFAFQYKNSPYVIMEKFKSGNATYVFEASKWEELTKFTKTEVMENKLYISRIFHNGNWKENIEKYLNIIK